ncbi:MAG: hypothetical protein ACREKS_09490 [Candidatus Rokuibacteriota bacterium]
MDPELRAAFEALDQRVETASAGLRQHVDDRMAAATTEMRRHFDVVAESLRSDIETIAEGLTGLSDRLDRVEANLREEILRSQRELSAMIRFSYAELDRKIQTLERLVNQLDQQYADLNSRVLRLEASR